MSNIKFQAAKELIEERQFTAARAVLKAMPEDPRAKLWLVKLDKIAPEIQAQIPLPPVQAWETSKTLIPRKRSSIAKPLLLLAALLIAFFGGVWLLMRNQQYQVWQSQESEASAALNVFCYLRLAGMNDISCDQWVTRLLDEDISRASDIMFCDGLYNRDMIAIGDDSYARLFINCLADRGIYLP